MDSKAFSSLTWDQLQRFAAKASLSEKMVLDTAKETVYAFKMHWLKVVDMPMHRGMIQQIAEHLKTIPIYL